MRVLEGETGKIEMKIVILLLLLISGNLATHFTQRSSNGFQSFRPIGVIVHFDVFEERVMALKKTVSYLDESKMSPYLKATFGRLSAMIDKTEKKFLDYRSFFLGQSTLGNAIEKRQAMILTGIAMSAAALYESFELDATIDEVKNRQNILVRHVDSLTDDMKTTVRNVQRLYGAIVLMKANSLSQSVIISLETAVLEMTTDSQRFFSGLDNLLNHKLSMEIVDNIDMKIEFEGLQDALRNEGFETVFQSVAQVCQLPATFVAVSYTHLTLPTIYSV